MLLAEDAGLGTGVELVKVDTNDVLLPFSSCLLVLHDEVTVDRSDLGDGARVLATPPSPAVDVNLADVESSLVGDSGRGSCVRVLMADLL